MKAATVHYPLAQHSTSRALGKRYMHRIGTSDLCGCTQHLATRYITCKLPLKTRDNGCLASHALSQAAACGRCPLRLRMLATRDLPGSAFPPEAVMGET